MKLTPTGNTPPAPGRVTMQTGKGDAAARAVAAFSDPNKVANAYTNLPRETSLEAGVHQAHQPKQPEHHSINPNNVSVEEMSAIRQPTEISDKEAQEVAPEQEPSQEKKVDPVLSRQFAQLARAEKAHRAKIQQQEQAFKAREAALLARETELKPQQIDPNKYFSVDDLKQNTLRKLAEAGITYEELTQQILNTSPTDPRTEAVISKQDARIAQLEAKLEEQAKSQQESQQQARQAAVKQITRDVTDLVRLDPTFETIKATNSVKDVVELIERTFDKDGIVLSAEEAAQEVENYLIDEALKLTRIGKIKSRLEKAGQPTPSQQKQTQKVATPMKTLTNAASSSRQLSARERALLAFKGELKS